MSAPEVEVMVVSSEFKLLLPRGWRPGTDSVELVVTRAERDKLGVINILLADDEHVVSARLERIHAVEEARRLASDQEDLDDVVDRTYGVWWVAGYEYGFVRTRSNDEW